MREAFKTKRFKAETLGIIARANGLVAQYLAQGLVLTVRQVYYQFVARGWLSNSQRSYKQLSNVLNDARMCGMLDWAAIEDRTRGIEIPPSWESPESILNSVAKQFRLNPWNSMDTRVEVWVEKEALAGVIENACAKWRTPWMACRGYLSASAMYESSKRIKKYLTDSWTEKVVILHLGDHDPSGVAMTYDNENRLHEMLRKYGVAGQVEVERIALTTDQIEEHDPPPNPAKTSDPRFASYEEEYGDESWELDALEPSVLRDLIHSKTEVHVDHTAWNDVIRDEERHRKVLQAISDEYDSVSEYVQRDEEE